MSAHYRCSEPDTSPAQPGKQWGSVLGTGGCSGSVENQPVWPGGGEEVGRRPLPSGSVGTVPALWEPLTSAVQKDLNGLAASFTIFPAGRADPAWAVAAGGEASRAPAPASACPLRGRRQAEGQSPSGQSRGVSPGPTRSRSPVCGKQTRPCVVMLTPRRGRDHLPLVEAGWVAVAPWAGGAGLWCPGCFRACSFQGPT